MTSPDAAGFRWRIGERRKVVVALVSQFHVLAPPRLSAAGDASAGPGRRHIPHTVMAVPPSISSRRKIFSSQRFPSVRSKTTRWPSAAALRSM